MKKYLTTLWVSFLMFVMISCGISQESETKNKNEEMKVTSKTFIRAETDRMFNDVTKLAGGINKFFHFRDITPLDKQTVIRMNRDVLYSGGVVNVEKGATIVFPEMPDDRYASVYIVDNDHYVPYVIYEPGEHKLPQDTRYLLLAVRIQLFNPNDSSEISMLNNLQDQFIIKANSSEEFPGFAWDTNSLDSLRAIYNIEFAKYERYPSDWQGPRGKVNEQTRHLAAAGAWGLFPEWDAIYINFNKENLSGEKCYWATYDIPENKGFWSITIYGADGYMKDENSVLNASNVNLNPDGTFTLHFGSKESCPNAKNRLDINDGWNFLMRVYLPGESVLNNSYKLPDVVYTE
jgi:hypothetical protein